MGTNKLRGILHQITLKTGINVDECKIKNHSARRTVIMILKASDVPKDEIMCFSAIDLAKGLDHTANPQTIND